MAAKSLFLYGGLFLFALIPTLLFGTWLRRQPWDLKEKISAWDPFIKVMAIAGAVIVGLATFDRFLDQREQEFLRREIEMGNAKAAVFDQAIRSASVIANAQTLSGAQEQEAVATFWRLYWGELVRIEGRQVESAMVRLGNAIQEWHDSGNKPENIQLLTLGLSRACEAELSPLQREVEMLRRRYIPSSSRQTPLF